MISKHDESHILKSLMHGIAALTRSESIVLSLLLNNEYCTYDDIERQGVPATYLNRVCRQLNEKLNRCGLKFKIVSIKSNALSFPLSKTLTGFL